MTRIPYTAADDTNVLEMREKGYSYPRIGRILGRSEDSIKCRHRLLTGYWDPPVHYPGCAALVRAQIATGQVQRQGLQDWVARHGQVMGNVR